MKTDLYNKTILTIIGISLVWVCISMTTSAFAERNVVDVNIIKVNGKASSLYMRQPRLE